VVDLTGKRFLEVPVEGYAACCDAIRDLDFTGGSAASGHARW
jgi:hypothetical protein